MKAFKPYYLTCCVLILHTASLLAQVPVSSDTLQPVTVTGLAPLDPFTSPIPAQRMDKTLLNNLSISSAADAARFFSGVLVRDYGGLGGLKTASVRSLGASHTGVLYDGVMISDQQNGQIDLGRYAAGMLESMELHQANTQEFPAPARSFSSAALISLKTKSYQAPGSRKKSGLAGLRQGSFGLWQPFGMIALPIGERLFLQAGAEAMHSDGDYPFRLENGLLSRNTKRSNGKINSAQGELNLLRLFNDSSTLQVKFFSYFSDRGLPGGIRLFSEQSNQSLYNADQFIQARYQRSQRDRYSWLLSAKYQYGYMRYTDPDFQNNAGGLNNQFRQQELYLSAAVARTVRKLSLSLASDAAYTRLHANLPGFVYPGRLSLWNNFSAVYNTGHWQLNGSVLVTTIRDETRRDGEEPVRNKLTPTLSAGFKPATNSPFLIRSFFKQVFRMPSFNDLYYVLIGNRSLRPEKTSQYDLGMVYQSPPRTTLQLNLSLDFYYNQVRDKIVAVPAQNLFSWTMLNIGEARIKGADLSTELSGLVSPQLKWQARIAYTYQQARDYTDPNAGNYKDRIAYTPDHSGSGLISFSYRSWSTGYSLLFSGLRYGIGDNNYYNELEGWGTQDIFLTKRMSLKNLYLDLKAELNNLTGRQYEIIRAYPMPGRNYRISITFLNQ